MTSIRKLASALFLVCCCSLSNAQTVESTGNLIDNGQWTGVGAYAPDPNDCCTNPARSQPLYDTSSDTIKFSYGQATVGQVIGINSALVGSGLQVNGYIFQYDAKTTSDNGSGSDPLTSSSYLKDGSGNTLLSTNYQHGIHDWQTFSVTRTLTDPYSISGGGTVGVEFSGYDQGYWAGLYGPEIRNVSLRLNYSVGEDPCIKDPLSSTSCSGYAEAYKSQQCSMNPLYDTTCPGYAQAYFDQQCSLNPLYDSGCPGYAQAYFNQQCGFNPLYNSACPGNSEVITSKNLVPNPGTWHRAVDQSFAINTALSHSGAGLQVHAFRWGFQTFGIYGSGDFKSDVNIRDSNGDSIYSFSTGWQSVGASYTDRSYYYQLPQSRNNLTLGTFDYTAEITGTTAVGNFWATILYTPDSCSLDPLSSPLCTKYQEAFLEQQCAIYTLYSPSCPGYAEALQEMLAQSMAYGVTDSSPTSDTSNISSNTGASTGSMGTSISTADPTKTDVTVDVGGVELSTTGEIVVADSIPSTVKEAAKESTKPAEEKQIVESSSVATAEKKTSKVNALAIAQGAARDAESAAKATAEASVAMSQSDAANPSDGTGATIELGGGLTLSNLQSMATAGQSSNTLSTRPQVSTTANVIQRQLSLDTQITQTTNNDEQQGTQITITENQTVAATIIEVTVNQNRQLAQSEQEEIQKDNRSGLGSGIKLDVIAAIPEIPSEPLAPSGPSVRRGGIVEGMEGGADMNALSKPPADFNSYLSARLTDGQFYSVKEIYKGQVNVDNARVLRGLGTDRLHQQMVDQQYNN